MWKTLEKEKIRTFTQKVFSFSLSYIIVMLSLKNHLLRIILISHCFICLVLPRRIRRHFKNLI